MNSLTSKIQYKTYEKGEFDAAEARSLADTLTLIKSFPWDTQRGVDVQASGPGIVIHGPADDYLKVAIYYNSKFTVYYLDPQNHLYEFHTADLDIADQKVIDFFNGTLSLNEFDKHFFNIGNRNHFITRSFEYRLNFWNTVFVPILAAMLFLLLVFISGSPLFLLFLAIVILVVVVALYSLRYATYYLKISKGHDEFWYGENADSIKCYNKQDIKEVIIFEKRNRGSYTDYSSEKMIYFKDGSVLRIPPVLISSLRFTSKFKDNLVHIEYPQSVLGQWLNKSNR